MPTLTIRVLQVAAGQDWQGNPCYYVTFRVGEWPDLGPWTTLIPGTFTLAQAKAKIEAAVLQLATNTHEWYGKQWTYTYP